MRTVSSHQPQYLPWPPYFKKIAQADVFVLMDTVQYQKNGLQNRNRIRGRNGSFWLTVPVHGAFPSRLCDMQLVPGWQRKHFTALCQSYSKSPYWKCYAPRIEFFYEQEFSTLTQLTTAFIQFFLDIFQLPTQCLLLSELPIISHKTQCLVDITTCVGGQKYLSGTGALEYLEPELFKLAGITVEILPAQAPEYPQPYSPFIAGLSMIDMLCNCSVQHITQWLLDSSFERKAEYRGGIGC